MFNSRLRPAVKLRTSDRLIKGQAIISSFDQRILLVTHQLDYSGAPNALLAAARCLRTLGYELDVLSLADGPLESAFFGVGVARVYKFDRARYSLVIFNTAVTARLAVGLAGQCRYILWLHESPNLFVHSDLPFLVAQAAEGASALLFPSASTADDWGRFGSLRAGKRLVFWAEAPLNIFGDFNDDKPRLEGTLTLLTVDPVEYFRGYSVLAKALEMFTEARPEVRTRLIAIGAAREKLLPHFASVKNLLIEATDRIPRPEVTKLMCNSDLYVSNSSYATQNLGLCEASALGVPALISDIPVHRVFAAKVVSSVVTYELFCPNDLFRKLLFVYNDLNSLKQLALSNRVKIREEYSDKRFNIVLERMMRAINV